MNETEIKTFKNYLEYCLITLKNELSTNHDEFVAG